jgi:hypothetical protein
MGMDKPGPTVKVGGVEYPTVIDGRGVQRFIEDPEVRAKYTDLNALAFRFATGTSGLTLREYAEINMKLGYSVCGFRDLGAFKSMEIENPLWGEP